MRHIKPLLLVLVLLFAATGSTYAQEHLKFMGIPLNGTIDNFQQKLAAKGIYVDKEWNKRARFGKRYFKGKFTGETCHISIFYTKKKIVYGAQVYYSSSNEADADIFYKKIKILLQSKYGNEYTKTEMKNGYEQFTVGILNPDGSLFGSIFLNMDKDRINYGETLYSVAVSYYDKKKFQKYQQEQLNDI